MCDFVTKAQLEAIAGKPNTRLDKISGGLACRFSHDYKVEGEAFPFEEFYGSVSISLLPTPKLRASSMKDFRDVWGDGRPYPCDVGDECAMFHKGQGVEARMNLGDFHVRFNAMSVRSQGASEDENIKLAQERSVQLMQLIATELATR